MRMTIAAALIVLAFVSTSGSVRHVPAQYGTIQEAINASTSGDTVLVGRGTYHENINFRGKDIVIGSMFLLSKDFRDIEATIIDGSTPASPDTGSCVIIASGEDSSAVLEGFTLTGGKGTRWQDKHNLSYYREGGGILTENASPTIRSNRIVNNAASNKSGVTSAGGGAIRSDGGTPRILNNIIAFNTGRYGAGITLNYTGAIIRNNLIYANTGGEDFGGSGIWAYATFSTPIIVENNTIVGNISALNAGGVLVWATAMQLQNNVIWGNRAATDPQIALNGGSAIVAYCDIEGGWSGTGNIDAYPAFADSLFTLADGSPCIDGGDPDPDAGDPPNDVIPTLAQWPSRGNVRNDIGVYGGPYRRYLRIIQTPSLMLLDDSLSFGYILPGESKSARFRVTNSGTSSLIVDSVGFGVNADGGLSALSPFPRSISPFAPDSLIVLWHPLSSTLLRDTLLIYHSGMNLSPAKAGIRGSSVPSAILSLDASAVNLGNIDHQTTRVDSSFTVYNIGTAVDSVYVTVDPKTVSPPSSVMVVPAAFSIAAGDSQTITFSVFPSQMVKTGLGIYSPVVNINSRFGVGTTHFAKNFGFKIVNWTDVREARAVPERFELGDAYPNPFNGFAHMRFQLPSSSRVIVTLYDILGRKVAEVLRGAYGPGEIDFEINANGLASGVYIIRLEARGVGGSYVGVKRLVLTR